MPGTDTVRFYNSRSYRHCPTPWQVCRNEMGPGYRFGGDNGFTRSFPHCSLVYTLGGQVVYSDGDNERVVTEDMGWLVRFPDPGHLEYVPASSPGWERVYFDWTGAEEMVAELISEHGSFFRMPPGASAIQVLLGYQQAGEGAIELSPGRATELVMAVLSGFQEAVAPRAEMRAGERLVRDARRMVGSRNGADIRVGELARALQVTPEHLSRVFRHETGRAPQELIAEEKTRQACQFLTSTALTCAEIAGRLGYSNPSNFGRSFRRAVGMTPTAFRRGAVGP